MEIVFKLRGRNRVWFNALCQMVSLATVHGVAVSPQYIFNPNKPVEFATCDVKYADVCAVQIAIALINACLSAACADLAATGTITAGLSSLQSGVLVKSMPGVNIGTFVLDRSTGERLVDTWVPGAKGALLDNTTVYSVVSQPTLLSQFQTAVDGGGGWVPHQYRWSAGGVAVPVLSYVKKCPVDNGHIIGTTIGREPLPASENSPPTFISMGGIRNAQRLVGMCTADILAARTWVDMERVFHDIVYTSKYRAGSSWYVFMTKVGDVSSTGLEIVGNSGGISVAHGKIPALIGMNSSAYRQSKGYSQAKIDQGHTLYVSQATAAVTGGRWNDYTWGPLDNMYYKISLVVGTWVGGQKYYLGTGFKMVAAPTTAGPNCGTCSALSNNGCAATNSLTLLSSALAMALTTKPEHDLWHYISHGYSDDYTDLFFNMSGGFFVFVFDYNGTCVADASEASNIGKPFSQLTPPGIDSTAIISQFTAAADLGGMWVRYPWRHSTTSYNKLAYVTKMYKYSKQFYMGVAFDDVTPPMDAQCSALYAEPCAEYSVHRMAGAASAALLGATSDAETSVVLQQIATSSSTGGFAVHPYDESFECPTALKSSSSAQCPPEITADEKLALMPLTKTTGGWATLASRTPGGHGVWAYVLPVNARFANIMLYSSVTNNNAPKCIGQCPSHSTCVSGRCTCDPGWMPSYSNTGACGKLTVKTMTCLNQTLQLCTIAGMGIFGKLGMCQSCTAGRYKPGTLIVELSPCLPCPVGEISNTIGATACTYCIAGKYSDHSASSICKACPAGTYAPGIGRSSCIPCPPGSYSEQEGSGSCKECNRGNYQADIFSTECHRCNGTMETTSLIGSISITACVCEESWYRPRGGRPGTDCISCPEGMTCDVGSAEDALLAANSQSSTRPLLKPGYWSSIGQPMVTFSCVDDSEDSPCGGGSPPGCKGGLVGTVCSQCPYGYKVGDAECEKCGPWEKAIVFVFLAAILIFPIVMMKQLVPNHTWRINANQTFGMTCEVLIEFGQTMASITSLRITWPTLVQGGLDFFEGLPFKMYDLDPVSSFPCFAPEILRSDFTTYLGMTVLIPGIAVYMSALYPICSRWLPARWRWDFYTTVHVILKFVNLVFISQVFLSMAPFQCYSHPSGNPKTSVQSYSGTFCDTREHTAMLVVGLMSSGFCVGFFAYLCWETRQIRDKLASHRDQRALKLYIRRVTFILEDFKLETYYWNLVAKVLEFALGGIFIALIPNSTRAQIFTYMLVFGTFSILWATFIPFKIPLLNLAISVIFVILIVVLALATTRLPHATSLDSDAMSALLSTAMCLEFLLFAVLLQVALVTLYLRGSRGKLLTISNLATIPSDKKILRLWEEARKWLVADLARSMRSWQAHELAEFALILLKFEAFRIGKRSSRRASFWCMDPMFNLTAEHMNAVCKKWQMDAVDVMWSRSVGSNRSVNDRWAQEECDQEKEELLETFDKDEIVGTVDDSLPEEGKGNLQKAAAGKNNVEVAAKKAAAVKTARKEKKTEEAAAKKAAAEVAAKKGTVSKQFDQTLSEAMAAIRMELAFKSSEFDDGIEAIEETEEVSQSEEQEESQHGDQKDEDKDMQEAVQHIAQAIEDVAEKAQEVARNEKGANSAFPVEKVVVAIVADKKIAAKKAAGIKSRALENAKNAVDTKQVVKTNVANVVKTKINVHKNVAKSRNNIQTEKTSKTTVKSPEKVKSIPRSALDDTKAVKFPERAISSPRIVKARTKGLDETKKVVEAEADVINVDVKAVPKKLLKAQTVTMADKIANGRAYDNYGKIKSKVQTVHMLGKSAYESTYDKSAKTDSQAALGTYTVQINSGLAVHTTNNWKLGAKVADLPCGSAVEVLEFATFKDRVRARIASPAGWISIKSTDGSQEFAAEAKPSVPSFPKLVVLGTYIVQLNDGLAVHTTNNWNVGAQVAELPYGTVVEVLEFGTFKDRMRARIASPAGWISIRSTDGSQEFAAKVPGDNLGV